MNKSRTGYGTDPKLPVWSGGAVAGNLFRGGMTIAVLVNWAAFIALFKNVLNGYPEIAWDTASAMWSVAVIGVFLMTMLFINHKDAFTQNSGRAISSGVPLALMLLMILDSLWK